MYVIPAQKNILFFLGVLERFVVTETFPKLALTVKEIVLWYFSISFYTGVFPRTPETSLFIYGMILKQEEAVDTETYQ